MGKLVVRTLLLLLAVQSGRSAERGPFDLEFQRLSDGVYLAFRPDPLRIPVEGNVLIIVNDEDVVVVDAGGSPSSAKAIIAKIRSLTDKPVRWLINTHGHGDHTVGNHEFVMEYPGVEIVSRPETRDYMVRGGLKYVSEIARDPDSRRPGLQAEIDKVKEEGTAGQEAVVAYLKRYAERDLAVRSREYSEAVIVAPTMTFDRRFTLHRGKRNIEVLFLGFGKTASDIVVYLPEEKLVAAGDMLTEPVPYGFSRKPAEWIKTLHALAELDFDTVVPGHGSVIHGKDYLNSVIRLVETLYREVEAGAGKGLSQAEIQTDFDASSFVVAFCGDDPVCRNRFYAWFLEPALSRVLDEVSEKGPRRR